MAGGKPPPRGTHFGAEYYNTTLAKQGDLGSELPKAHTGVAWKAGTVVEVSWAIEANHGGGCAPVDLLQAQSQLTPINPN
eukprot:SAG31_NODE_699_length_12741_cov_5.762617_12_plen_80_part_00